MFLKKDLELVCWMLWFLIVISLGRVVMYTVFMVFSLPQTLVKTLAKNLVKNPGQKSGHKSEATLTTGGEG